VQVEEKSTPRGLHLVIGFMMLTTLQLFFIFSMFTPTTFTSSACFGSTMNTKGISMYPTLQNGDIITGAPPVGLKAGDIITYQRKGDDRFITHRLHTISTIDGKTYYVPLGDNNKGISDPAITLEEIVNKVICRNGVRLDGA